MKRAIFTLLFFLFGLHLAASDLVRLSTNSQVDITEDFEYRLLSEASNFKTVPKGGLRMEPGLDTVLMKLSVENPINQRKAYYLFFHDPSLHYINLINGGRSGAAIEAGQRDVHGNRYAFRIMLDPNQSKTLFFKVFSKNKITLSASVADSKTYLEQVTKERFHLGLFYGVILLVFLYSLLLLVTTRLRMFAYYAGYIFFVGLLCGGGDGITSEFVPGWIVWKEGFQDAIAAALSNVMGMMFMILFLNVKSWSLKYYKFLVGFLLFYGITCMILLLTDSLYIFDYLGLIGIVLLGIIIFTSIRAYRNNVPQAGYYLGAYVVFGVFILLFIANMFRLVEYSFWTQYAIHVGYGFSLIILSFGLGVRINSFYREALIKEQEKKEIIAQKNEELEQKVWARTNFLNQKEANLRSIIDNSQDIIWLVDNDYKLIEHNIRFGELWNLAYDREISIGTSMLDQANSENDRVLYKIRYDHALEGNVESYMDKYEINGKSLSYEIRMFPILSEGNIRGVAVFASDVTSRIKNEKKLTEQYELLRKVNEELDSFVYSASHDLKAPLASILGLINISRKARHKELPQYFDMMETSIKRLDQFIKDIIDYSRNARTNLAYEQVDPALTINSCLADLQFMQSQKNCSPRINVESKAPLYIDPTRFRVILRNLISNAIKYGCQGEKENIIEIEASISQRQIILKVTDYGDGIPKEFQADIFKMFFRAHDTVSGTGLGLYIVKQTLDKLGGKIKVYSEQNHGTTFEVKIPNGKVLRTK